MVELLQNCPVCAAPLRQPGESLPDTGGHAYDCPRCGQFGLEDAVRNALRADDLSERQRASLSHVIRLAQSPDARPLVTASLFRQNLKLMLLPTPLEQADNLLRFLAEAQPVPGEPIAINVVEHRAIAGSVTDGGFIFVVRWMQQDGLIEATLQSYYVEGIGHLINGEAIVVLTFRGWERCENLRRGGGTGHTAFIAMKFGCDELTRIVDEHFRPAVKETGFTLRRLDDVPKAGLIDDRLRVEIKAARFLLADLTHGNPGAYWEAGYAEGLGKPVIYTCRQSVFDDPGLRPHFDTNHHLTISWDPERPEEAAEMLKATIRATLPDAKLA